MSTNITTNATNKTPNYGLPIFIGSDKPSWLTDWNGSMTEIDSLLKQIETVGSANSTQIEGLKTSLETANNAITALQDGLSTTTENTTKNTTDIGTLNNSVRTVQDDLIAQNALVKTLSTTVSGLSETVERLETDVPNISTSVNELETTVSTLSNKVTELEGGKMVRKIVKLNDIPYDTYNYGTFYNHSALDLGTEFDTSKPIIATLCFKDGNENELQHNSTSVIGTNESNAPTLSLGITIFDVRPGSGQEGSFTKSDSCITVSLYHGENGKVYFKANSFNKGVVAMASDSSGNVTTRISNLTNTSSGAIGTNPLLREGYLIFEQ